MEKNNFEISYKVLDAEGNGQEVVFRQFGIGYEKLLELQGKVVQPTIASLNSVTGGWFAQAVDALKGKGKPPDIATG